MVFCSNVDSQLHKVVLTFESVDEKLRWTTQIKAFALCFSVIMLIMLQQVVRTLSLWIKY